MFRSSFPRFLSRAMTFFGACIASLVSATSGDLDKSFGNRGKVITDFEQRQDTCWGVAVQSDGKIVISGHSYKDSTSFFSLARYLPNGSLDPTFGVGGKVTYHSGNYEGRGYLMIQSTGKIVVVGSSDREVIVRRFNTDGSLDTSFGNQGVVRNSVASRMGVPETVLLLSEDNFLVAGFGATGDYASDFFVLRFQSDGTPDPNFGSEGKVITAFPGGEASANTLKLQSDGKILAGGFCVLNSETGRATDFALARYNPDGSLDTGFGTGGIVITDVSSLSSYLKDLTVEPDGKILATGLFYQLDGTTSIAQVRYDTSGSIDTSFANPAKTFDTKIVFSECLKVLRGGKVLVTGGQYVSEGDFAFALGCYGVDGKPDSGFGKKGIVTVNVDEKNDAGSCLTLQPNGQILAGGKCSLSEEPNIGDFLLLRFEGTDPDIIVEQPEETALVDGSSTVDFGTVLTGRATDRVFTIKNDGYRSLTGLTTSTVGSGAGSFAVVNKPIAPLTVGTSTTFTVRFSPTNGGTKTAVLRIVSNDPDESPFKINIEGSGIPPIPPVVRTLPATNITATSATLRGSIDAEGHARIASFEYGTTAILGLTSTATPGTIGGSGATPVSS